MQSWVWGYTYPDFMDAIMPLASLPVEIAGRNRMQRDMVANLLKWILNGKRRVQSTTNSGSVWGNWSLMFMVSIAMAKISTNKRRSRGNVR
jgi:homoserine O-acetyltransferase